MALEKYDVSNMNNLIANTGQLIDDDPLLSSINEVNSIKENFDAIQEAISSKTMDNTEKTNFLAKVFGSMIGKDKDFHFKSFEGKINSVFRQFDLIYDSINNTAEVYREYWEGLVNEINSIEEFLNGINHEELDVKEQREVANYVIMQKNLSESLTRITMSSTSAEELLETMRVGRPIFQAILSSCMIEVAGQRSIDASVQMISTITSTIDGLSSKLTQSAIKSSQIALEVGSKPVLSIGKIEDNMKLLWGAMEDLEKSRQKYLLNTKKDD